MKISQVDKDARGTATHANSHASATSHASHRSHWNQPTSWAFRAPGKPADHAIDRQNREKSASSHTSTEARQKHIPQLSFFHVDLAPDWTCFRWVFLFPFLLGSSSILFSLKGSTNFPGTAALQGACPDRSRHAFVNPLATLIEGEGCRSAIIVDTKQDNVTLYGRLPTQECSHSS